MKYEEVKVNSKRWLDLKHLLNEIFKPVKGYEGLYEVSNYGRVKSLGRNVKCRNNHQRLLNTRILKIGNNGNGYLIVNLSKNNKINIQYVHRLVAETFILNPNNYRYINHKDENSKNNMWTNLEWCTAKYNSNYGTLIERMTDTKIKKYGKKVNQYDLDGNFIRSYNSLSLIQKEFNYCCVAIANCCKGKSKTSYGYIWRYADEM